VNGYVAAGYGIPLVTLAAYAAWVVVRGRALSRRAAPEVDR
jgi:hypothetical protein